MKALLVSSSTAKPVATAVSVIGSEVSGASEGDSEVGLAWLADESGESGTSKDNNRAATSRVTARGRNASMTSSVPANRPSGSPKGASLKPPQKYRSYAGGNRVEQVG